MKAVVTITTDDADDEARLKEWLAEAHGSGTPFGEALHDEVQSWLTADSGAEVTVTVNVTGEEV